MAQVAAGGRRVVLRRVDSFTLTGRSVPQTSRAWQWVSLHFSVGVASPWLSLVDRWAECLCAQLTAWALPTFSTPVLPSPTVRPCVGHTLSLEVSKIRAEALVWKGSKPPP